MKTTRIGMSSVMLALIAAFVSCLNCHWSPFSGDDVSHHDVVARESFSYEVNVTGQTRLRLQAINGQITITGVDGQASVTIHGERRVESHNSSDAEAYLRELEVRVDDAGTEVFVETIQPKDSDGRNYIVNYDISIPKDMEVMLNHINGSITLLDLLGSHLVDLVNGPIEGRLSLPPNGIIDLSTVNGTLDLDIPKGTSARVMASVVNGSINLHNLPLHDSTSTKTSLRGTLGSGRGTILLNTVNGAIDVKGY
jgi:DUF4097 and DUF4098 domain-containing protein YvlB